MRIIILFGLLATAHSEVVFHTGFTNEVDVENFKAFDLNGDGILHFSETFTTFRDVDTNDDGVWSFEEFADKCSPDIPPLQAQIAFDFADTLDSAVDGVIDSSVTCAFFSIMDVDNNRKAILGEYKNASHQAKSYFKTELKTSRDVDICCIICKRNSK
ncbi:uncharacterized protein LOC112567567 [Pomacea canaliculata]|uniref:uncharacterized protein LOC112567567 n=1 Tax=Pomacea canaliculata TaxID=400727 RepID=UPI000D726E3C|nr:uncharacterized protein LOC112567567 [Pomacea canaliculata]